ncbi:MAG: response regulator transcription factor [Bacteroidales bacterium]|nr:response regulator transcription factor [Bacteroidales bacterium]
MKNIRVYIIEDDLNAANHLKSLCDKISYLKIVGSSSSVPEAISEINKMKPDLLFLDVELQDGSGFDLLKMIEGFPRNPGVIFVTGFSEYAIEAIRNRGIDYLMKPVYYPEFVSAVSRYVDLHNPSIPQELLDSLSSQEKNILYELVKGQSSKEIAGVLSISRHTVDTHRRNILTKCQVTNTKQLVALCARPSL